MKKWMVIQAAAVLLIAVVGLVCRFNFPDRGFSSMHTQEDMLTGKIGVEYVIGQNWYDSLIQYPGQFDNLRRDSAIIAIAKPTGNIFQEGDIFGQEIVVTKILKGEDRIKADGLQDHFYVFDADGFRVYDDGQIRYFGGYGLMQKASEYLVFLESVRYAALFPVKGYGNLGGFFGMIKLSDAGDRSAPVTVPVEDLLYDDVWDYEYIAESEAVLEQMYLMKARILKMMEGELGGK